MIAISLRRLTSRYSYPNLHIPFSTVAKSAPNNFARSLMANPHPVLSRLLQSNAQWAEAAIWADPDYFKQGVKGQSPKVRFLASYG